MFKRWISLETCTIGGCHVRDVPTDRNLGVPERTSECVPSDESIFLVLAGLILNLKPGISVSCV